MNYRHGIVTVRLLAVVAAVVWLAVERAPAQVVLVPTNAAWKFLDNGSDQGTAWRAPLFDDNSWMSGMAELGFGDGVEGRPEATPLNPGPTAPNQYITYYFRHRFNVIEPAEITNLVARVMRDDGAVVYLNGTEAGRTGMGAGAVNYLTPAASPGTSGADEYVFFAVPVDPELLVEGENVLAVEVHQLSGSSSDLSFALELLVITNAAPPPPPPGDTLIIPPSVAPVTTAYGAGTLRGANLRLQQVYGSVNFPPDVAFWITELRFRPDAANGGAFVTTVGNIQINLSTTARNPGALSLTYENNLGFDDTIVHSGSLAISSQFIGPPGAPKDFDIVVPLQTPFLYDPGAGNLLMDIRNFTGSGASLLSGQNSGGDSASRVAGTTSSTTAQGADSGIDALQIVYSLTNPPPRPPAPTLLLRGPYLQSGTVSNIMVCWRTSRTTNSLVRFGLAPGTLTWTARDETRTNNHCVTLTNLAPDTKYYYAIGAEETNLVGGADYYFTTAPPAGTPKPTRIWALGDCGTASQPGQTGAFRVRDAYYAFAGNRETDVWLMLGDNAYGYGKDSEYQSAVFDVYQAALRRWPLWSTVGNHETYSPIAPEPEPVAYWDIFRLPMQGEAGGIPSGTERYYSFDYANIHFVCLDSEHAFTNNNGADMLQWLDADLTANTNEWLIAFWHSPPYTKGSHNSDSISDGNGNLFWMRQQVGPILESHGVDLVLGGHSHSYERSRLIRGHYGLSTQLTPSMVLDPGSGRIGETGPYRKVSSGPMAHAGTVYIVAGSSGWATFLQGDAPHPAMYRTLLNLGSMVIDVDGSRLDGRFLRENGIIDDSFTIIKDDGTLRIASFNVTGGILTAQFSSVPGKTYRLERTLSLDTPSWATISGDIPSGGYLTTWSGPVTPADAGKSFYRAVQID